MEGANALAWKLIAFSLLLSVLTMLVMLVVAPLIPNVYQTSDDVRQLATRFLRIYAFCLPLISFCNSAYFTLRSGGKTFVTFLFDSVFSCVIVAPTAYLLSRYTEIPIVWLFLCCESLDLVKCTVGFFMIRSGVWIQNIVKEEY
jgi:Na+-driven multidrug efflux pump